MPRETLRKLSENVERLLVAGAHLAQGDSGLERDKAALEKLVAQLGAKAPPVLAKLAEAAGKARTAKPKEQAHDVLTLATTTAQVRAAQTQLASVDADEPLTVVGEIGTPCNAKDLYALHDALVEKGPGRMEKVAEALERGDVADLRLVHAVVQALGDSYGELAERVSNEVVPAFGRAIIEPVRSRLKFPGRVVDGRRLKALVAVEKEASRPLVEQALREGSPEMREAALEAVADHLPGVPAFEPVVLGLIEKERTGDVRRAAIHALKGYGSDASLEALLEALDDPRTVRAAADALGSSKHPKVVHKLLARLAQAATERKVKVKKGDKVGEKKQSDATIVVQALLGALAERNDPSIVPAARELIDDYGSAAAYAVLGSAAKDDLKALADLLDGDDDKLFAVAVAAAMKLDPKESFVRLSAPFSAKDRDKKIGEARANAVARSEVVPTGDDWAKALMAAAKLKPRSEYAIRMLGKTKDPKAVPMLIALLEDDPKNLNDTAYALGAIGDQRALDPLLAILEKGKSRHYWSLSSTIEGLADEKTVDRVRTIHAAEKSGNTYSYISYLLRRLERKFPGA
ncbi:hypothetical protein BH09MYX1_BH09MYX1_46660 [soil metagenome]